MGFPDLQGLDRFFCECSALGVGTHGQACRDTDFNGFGDCLRSVVWNGFGDTYLPLSERAGDEDVEDCDSVGGCIDDVECDGMGARSGAGSVCDG